MSLSTALKACPELVPDLIGEGINSVEPWTLRQDHHRAGFPHKGQRDNCFYTVIVEPPSFSDNQSLILDKFEFVCNLKLGHWGLIN